MDYKTIMAEFKDANGVLAAKRKHFVGVSKKGNSWQAIIRDPKLKIEVYLGYYSTPEEAAFVVKKKKAEFEDKLKGEDTLRMKRCGNAFQETESEEAALVVKKKKAEFEDKFKGEDGIRLKRCGNAFQETECEEAALVVKKKKAEFEEKFKGEDGIREKRCGNAFQKTESEGAALVVKKKKAEFEEKFKGEDCLRLKRRGNEFQETEREEANVVADRKRAELREMCGGKVRGSGECEDDDEVLLECESDVTGNFECSDEQTSDVNVPATAEDAIRSYDKRRGILMGYDGLNIVEIGDKPNCGVVDVPDIKPGTSNSGCVRHKRVIGKMSQRKITCSLDFDEAVRAGFINEYGQLVGKFCELDEQMCLGLTDENFAAS